MITYEDLLEQNPWWQPGAAEADRHSAWPEESRLPRRACVRAIQEGLARPFVQVLLGVRRVGKSTILRQLIADLLEQAVEPRHVFYFSFDRYAVEKTPACVFRRKPDTDSDLYRTPIPIQTGHSFR